MSGGPAVLVASSPVEIDAKAEETGLSSAAHEAARRMFHDLTSRLGQAAVALSVSHQEWPNHRFYFSAEPDGMAALLAGLRARPDMIDVTRALSERPDPVEGLYVQASDENFTGVLVGHENHEGYSHRAEPGSA